MSTVTYQYFPLVAEIQMMLNTVRNKYHGSWEHLSVDGKYGPISKNAVTQFKISIGFTPVGDVVTSEFVDRLREEYNRIPKLLNSTDNLIPYYDTGKLENRFPILKIIDTISDLFDNINDFVEGEMEYIRQTGRAKAGIIQRLGLHISRFDNRFAQWRNSLETAERSQSAIDTQKTIIKQNEDLARQASKGDFSTRPRNPADTLRARTAQSTMNKAEMISRAHQANLDRARNSARSVMKEIMEDLKKYDLVGKINRKVQEIMPKGGQYGIGKIKIPMNVGGSLLALVPLKDLIYDLFTYEDSDAWRVKAMEHLFDFIDGVIIGFVSAILAEIIVLAGAAIVGASGAAGAIAIIIAVVAVVIAIAIGYFFDKHDISLSRMVVDYCADIVPAF